MWPLALLLFLAGCALETRGQYAGDASGDDVANDVPPDIEGIDVPIDSIEAPDSYDAPDEYIVETADADSLEETIDADSPDEFVTDSADTPDETGPCVGNLSPRSFHLLSPIPDEPDVSTKPTFSWGIAIDPEAGPVICALTVDDNEDFSSPVLVRSVPQPSGATENTYSFLPTDPALGFGRPHWWKVDCSDNCGNVKHAELSPRSFTTRAYPICSKIGSDVRVTTAGGDSLYPALVWNGSGFAVAWQDNRDGNNEIYLKFISESGVPSISETCLTDGSGASESPSMAWTGSHYGVSFNNNRSGHNEIYFDRISPDGSLIDRDIAITIPDGHSSYLSSLAWAGTMYGLSWTDDRDGNDEIYFRHISEAAVPLGSESRLSFGMNISDGSSLTWTGSNYGVGWHDNRGGNYEIYFSSLSGDAIPLISDVPMTSSTGNSASPSMGWSGDEYGLSWNSDSDGNFEIYFARISESGIASTIRVTDDIGESRFPSLVWAGTEWGIAWNDTRDGNYEIYFRRISELGGLIASDMRITNDPGLSGHARLVWTGSEYGIAWNDNRAGNYEIYFARIGCEP